MPVTKVEPKSEKIVIIESSPIFGKQIQEDLTKDGYKNVYLFKSGEEGLKGLFDIIPHLVLLDISLSDMDGYKILSEKQAEPLLAKIPVFLLSVQATAINMHDIPPKSVMEVIISLNAKSIDVLNKVNSFFGYGSSESEESNLSKVASSEKKKLLWIEDDKLIGTILGKKLISSGFDLMHAKNGEEALTMIRSRKPDVIVVDLILPGLNGFEIIQRINEDEELKKIPKMVLSNLSKVSDMDRAKSLNVKKYLVKASTSLDQVVVEIKDMCK